MRRQRGFSLMEIMIAMALAGIVTAAILSLVRTQLNAFEMNDQIMRTQQNVRAAMDFIESNVRRACGGTSQGWIAVNVPGVTQQAVPCLQWFDGANIPTSAGTEFSTGTPSSNPDALEVVYATGTMTYITDPSPNINTTTPIFNVGDVSQFAVGDFVLVGDYANAYLFKVTAISATSTSYPAPGSLSFGTLPSNVKGPTGTTISVNQYSPVFKAQTYSFFVAPTTDTTGYASMLMVDPNGVASPDHSSSSWNKTINNIVGAQPAIEGVVDFQIAIGTDNSSTGTPNIWIGSTSGSTLSSPPWFTTGSDYPKQVRISIVARTLQDYAGSTQPATTFTFEDRSSTGFPSSVTTSAAHNPRYRASHMIVSPRAWNLTE